MLVSPGRNGFVQSGMKRGGASARFARGRAAEFYGTAARTEIQETRKASDAGPDVETTFITTSGSKLRWEFRPVANK